MSRPANYAWDSTVLLAWLGEEATAPLADIGAVVEQIDLKSANLIISVVAYSEVLEAKHTKEQMDRFKQFLKRSNIIVVNMTVMIADKTQQIRSRGLMETPKRQIRTPDAMHMATAIFTKADVLHSLDNGMLNLNGHATVDGLKITKPALFGGQPVLF